MDPFTQKILQRAEKRAAALGISSTSKFPLSEYNQETSKKMPASPTKSFNKIQRKPNEKEFSTSPRQTNTIVRQISTSDNTSSKDNVDVAVEINITTSPNVQVEVEVSECEVDANGKVTKIENKQSEPDLTDAKSLIRDSSRNQLQRLGALYSETEDLSSPIHRTEGRFHEELQSKENTRPKTKLAKLAMLADSINNWEDDTSHPDYKQHKETFISNSPVKTAAPKNTGATPKKYPAPNPPKSILTPQKPTAESAETDKSSKQLKWDQRVMDALELQGYKRRESTTSKLVYEYKKPEEIQEPEKKSLPHKERAPEVPNAPKIVQENKKTTEVKESNRPAIKNPEVAKGLVSGRAAMFENSKPRKSMARNQKDPAEMSLKERMAIFEKNRGTALVPKAAFGMSASIKQISTESLAKCDQKEKFNDGQKSKISSYNKSVVAESKAAGSGIRNTVAALMSNGTTISESQIAEDVRKQRQQEMDLLLNRFNKPNEQKPIPSAPPLPPSGFLTPNQQHIEAQCILNKRRSSDSLNDSPEVRSTLDDVKRIRVAPPKSGCLYPALSDIESTATESDQDYTTATVSGTDDMEDGEEHYYGTREEDDSYMDSEDAADSDGICDVSLGREIMQAVKLNDKESSAKSHKKRVSISQHHQERSLESSTSEISDVLDDMDEYLDEALEDDGPEYDTPRKGSVSSDSFSYQKHPRHVRYQTISEEESDCGSVMHEKEDYRSPVKSELTINPSDDNNMVTLVHTVSFYRRQQSSQNNTPMRKVTRSAEQKHVESSAEETDDSLALANQDTLLVQEKVKKLMDEVCKQQTVISQTSQALNLCAATIEFSGSTESIEAERHLLVATHRRQTILDEIQRLRVESCLRPIGAPQEKGRLTMKDITVPLKQEYIRKLASDSISGHHLVCLLKYNENVMATKTVPTLPGLLSVRFPDVLQLNNVFADFKITMEIYGMTAQREVLPHDIKYHIGFNKKGSSKMLTPKGGKHNSRLIMPPVQSPAGPQAVRSPALVQYGFIIFSLKEIQRTSWTLNPVAGMSPLEGTVHMKVNCELSVTVDYRGFLTMFEDISGFGAWHRRWCRLHGHVLSYWRYPDDEKKKAPMGSIDLQTCCTQKVGVAPRDVCARLNTLLLEFKRPSQDSDVDSLILVRHGKTTILRHLLSADSKEEREEWCAHINKTLALLKAWGHTNSN